MDSWSTFGTEVRSRVSQRGPRCGVALMLDDLPDNAQAAVRRALTDRAITTTAIQDGLKVRGVAPLPSLFTLGNHRRGRCKCES